jgi:type IV pilus assembly protein PilB
MLKHILRQDPDIIMVGEIRDEETARIAVQAALTGHLVLSTLHTNDALSAVSRLMDMGVEPYLLASAVIGVVAQRLIRQICSECKTTYIAGPEIVAAHGWDSAAAIKLAKGRGCPACYDSGYKGRFAIHELLQVDNALSQLIARGASRDELRAHAIKNNHKDLVANGLERVLEGRTTPEEVARVIYSE